VEQEAFEADTEDVPHQQQQQQHSDDRSDDMVTDAPAPVATDPNVAPRNKRDTSFRRMEISEEEIAKFSVPEPKNYTPGRDSDRKRGANTPDPVTPEPSRRRRFDAAGGRFRDGTLTIDRLGEEEARRHGLEDLGAVDNPPTHDGRTRVVVSEDARFGADWTNQRNTLIDTLEQDPLYQFVELVSGFTNTSVEAMSTIDTSQTRQRFEQLRAEEVRSDQALDALKRERIVENGRLAQKMREQDRMHEMKLHVDEIMEEFSSGREVPLKIWESIMKQYLPRDTNLAGDQTTEAIVELVLYEVGAWLDDINEAVASEQELDPGGESSDDDEARVAPQVHVSPEAPSSAGDNESGRSPLPPAKNPFERAINNNRDLIRILRIARDRQVGVNKTGQAANMAHVDIKTRWITGSRERIIQLADRLISSIDKFAGIENYNQRPHSRIVVAEKETERAREVRSALRAARLQYNLGMVSTEGGAVPRATREFYEAIMDAFRNFRLFIPDFSETMANLYRKIYKAVRVPKDVADDRSDILEKRIGGIIAKRREELNTELDDLKGEVEDIDTRLDKYYMPSVDWNARPENSGRIRLKPIVMACIAQSKKQLEGIANVRGDTEILMTQEHLRTQFAHLVATNIMATRYKVPTRSYPLQLIKENNRERQLILDWFKRLRNVAQYGLRGSSDQYSGSVTALLRARLEQNVDTGLGSVGRIRGSALTFPGPPLRTQGPLNKNFLR
jgi:hypothetical protein